MQMVYLKKMFIYFLGAIGSAGFTFLILPIVTMYLSPEEYGKTSMFYIMQSFFICIIFLGLDQAFSREFYENKNKKELFSTAIWGSVCFTTLVFIIIYFFFFNQLSFLLFESIECKQLTFLFSISLFFCIWERFGLLYLRMDNQVNLFAGFSVLMKALIFFFTLFLLNFSTKATFELVVLGHLLGQILGVVCLMIWLIGKYSLVLLFVNFKLLKRLLKFGLPVVFGTVIYCFILNIDKILLKNL
ncbi:polysaccharide biosynthesis protein, partial [Enterococcus faecalis]|nr:polysaccharide biosynthesis protein [Enterococcus faecalis]